MGKSSSEPVSAPTYDFSKANAIADRPVTFSYPFGTGTLNGGNYNWVESANQAQKRGITEKNVNDILATMGVAGTQGTDPYTKAYLDETLRYSQPRTENALIGRGLGGSTVYRDALTDLINKASNQAVLNSREQKRSDVASLENVLGALNALGMNVGQQTLQSNQQNQQLAKMLMDQSAMQTNADWQTNMFNQQQAQAEKNAKWQNLAQLALAGGTIASIPWGGGNSLLSMGVNKIGGLFGPSNAGSQLYGGSSSISPSSMGKWLSGDPYESFVNSPVGMRRWF